MQCVLEKLKNINRSHRSNGKSTSHIHCFWFSLSMTQQCSQNEVESVGWGQPVSILWLLGKSLPMFALNLPCSSASCTSCCLISFRNQSLPWRAFKSWIPAYRWRSRNVWGKHTCGASIVPLAPRVLVPQDSLAEGRCSPRRHHPTPIPPPTLWAVKKPRVKSTQWGQPWTFTGRTDGEAEAPILRSPDANSRLIGKDPDAGKDWRWEEKMEDEMVGWHHRCDVPEFEQAPGDGEGHNWATEQQQGQSHSGSLCLRFTEVQGCYNTSLSQGAPCNIAVFAISTNKQKLSI